MPTLIRFIVARDDVQTGAQFPALHRLWALSQSRKQILECQESMSLSISGYEEESLTEEDRRDLQLYLQKISREWPHWGWFLTRDDESLPILMSLLSGNGTTHHSDKTKHGDNQPNPEKGIQVRLRSLIECSEWLFADHEIPEDMLHKSRASARRKLGLDQTPT